MGQKDIEAIFVFESPLFSRNEIGRHKLLFHFRSLDKQAGVRYQVFLTYNLTSRI